jgi:hypothetical protein
MLYRILRQFVAQFDKLRHNSMSRTNALRRKSIWPSSRIWQNRTRCALPGVM